MQSQTGSSLLKPREMLPALRLHAEPGETRIDLTRRPDGRALAMLFFPSYLSPFRTYLAELKRAADQFRLWGGRVVLVAPEDAAARELSESTDSLIEVLTDRDGQAARRCGLTAGGAGVIVADRFGEIYEAAASSGESEMTSPGEIVEWLKYLATQCPECGVVDAAGGGGWPII